MSEKQTESKKTKNTEKQNMYFLAHICEFSFNGEMICEGLATAFGETNRSVTDVIIKSQSSVGGITAEIRQYILLSPNKFLGGRCGESQEAYAAHI